MMIDNFKRAAHKLLEGHILRLYSIALSILTALITKKPLWGLSRSNWGTLRKIRL
jgi:hypothetical protein